jgi:hypothetical protein
MGQEMEGKEREGEEGEERPVWLLWTMARWGSMTWW